MQSRSKIWKTVLVVAALALATLARVHAAPVTHDVPVPKDGGVRDEHASRPADNDKRATGPKQGMGGTTGGVGGMNGSGGAGGVGGVGGGSGGMSGSGGAGGIGGGGGMSGYGPGPMKPTAR